MDTSEVRRSSSSTKKKELAQEVECLTIHGPSRIASATSKWRRLIWTVLFLSSVGVLISTFVETMIKHLNRDVYVKEDRKTYSSLALPAMTFCNTNMYSTPGDPLPIPQYLPENCSLLDDWYFENQINKRYFKMACRLFLANYSEGSIGMLASSKFVSGNYQFPNNFVFLPNAWPCFTMNRYSTLIQNWGGEKHGLRMVLYYDENEYSGTKLSEKPIDDDRQGLYMNFHDPKEHMRVLTGVYLSPGYHIHIRIKKIIKKRLPSPFRSNCVKDGEEGYQSIVTGKHVMENCFFSCLYIAMYNDCGYVPHTMRAFMPNNKYPDKDILKSEKEYAACRSNFFRKKFSDSQCNCRLPCYEETYETKTSRHPWPQSWQDEMFSPVVAAVSGEQNRNYSIDEIRRKLLKISVYYDELSEVIYEEKELYGFLNIVSDVGGQMGLLIGASCISLIEIIFLLMDAISARWFVKREKRQTNTADF